MNHGGFNHTSRPRGPPIRNPGDFNPSRVPGPAGFRGDPLRNDMMRRDMISDPYMPRGDPAVRGPDPLSVQAQVLVIDPERRCRDFAERILLRLKKIGLICDIIILDKFMSPSQVIDDATTRGLLYTASTTLDNERHKSITINILQGQPQEHRNMPFDDALKLVARNFDAHLLKLADSKAAPAPVVGRESPETVEEIDPTLSLLLINLAEGKSLRLPDLDKVLKYLNEKREKFASKQEPRPPTSYEQVGAPIESLASIPKPVQPPIHKIPSLANKGPSQAAQQAEDLQAKITQLFGDSNKQQSTVGVKPPSSAVAHSYSPAGSTYSSSQSERKSSVGIDFSNPSVQNALQNLMKTGPNILESIRNTSTAVPTTPSQHSQYSTSPTSVSTYGSRAPNRRFDPSSQYGTSEGYPQTSTAQHHDTDSSRYEESPRPVKRAKPGRHAIAGFY